MSWACALVLVRSLKVDYQLLGGKTNVRANYTNVRANYTNVRANYTNVVLARIPACVPNAVQFPLRLGGTNTLV